MLYWEKGKTNVVSLVFSQMILGAALPEIMMVVFQLRIEQRRGRVFDGWSEGKIYFPPTYKYSNNSDRYAGEDRRPKEKRRTPAW